VQPKKRKFFTELLRDELTFEVSAKFVEKLEGKPVGKHCFSTQQAQTAHLATEGQPGT
jgi:hypothetical protein